MKDWVYQFDIAAIVFMSVILWMQIKFKNLPLESNRFFKYILIVTIIASFADLFSIYVLLPNSRFSLGVQYLAQILYLIPNMLGASLYYALTCSMTKPYRKPNKFRLYFIIGVEIIDTIFVLLSPWFHLLFYIEDGVYKHGPLMTFRYLLAGYLMCFVMVDTFRYHRLLTKAQKRMSYGYTILCIVSLILQNIFPNVMLLNFAVSVAALLGYFALQNPADFMDEVTNLQNKSSFTHSVASYFQQKDKFSLICVEYKGLEYVEKILGSSSANSILKQLSTRILSITGRTNLHRIGYTRFVYLLPHDAENIPKIVEAIQDFGDIPLSLNGTNLKFRPVVCTLHAPESMTYAEDVPDAIDYGLTLADASPLSRWYCDVRESALVKKRREAAILHILRRAILNKEFEVAYQPVYSCSERRFVGAEALARLEDPALGFVSPAEFIPVAERNGLMPELGEIIIETVCNYINKTQHLPKSLERIAINLSPVQCLQPNFATLVLAVTERTGVSPDKLEFEVTTKMIENTKYTFIPLMETLSNAGVHFVIDDYSFQFKDEKILTELKFNTIKISKKATDSITANERMLPAVRHSIAAFIELGYNVVATGIETGKQAEIFKSFGCDLLQGFLYSKPLSALALIDELKKN